MSRTRKKNPNKGAKGRIPVWRATLNARAYAKRYMAGFTRNAAAITRADDKALAEAARGVLEKGKKRITAQFRKDNDGALFVGGHALLMDSILMALVARITGDEHKGFAVIATGGYGRGELAPHSDIDLLFLTAGPGDGDAEIKSLLYVLWDMGLEVGHGVRDVAGQLKAVRSDITIATAMLDARFIGGDEKLFIRAMQDFNSKIIPRGKTKFIKGKLDERDLRHQRCGDQRYMVEPNIKDGKGGLRDLHTLYWIARYAHRLDDIDAVIESGILGQDEAYGFATSRRFLLTVRCHLHLRAGREDDRLGFDAQMDIARAMGYRTGQGMKRVERFMRRYHLTAKSVGSLTRIFCAAYAVGTPRRIAAASVRPFRITRGRLNLAGKMDFGGNPELMMKIFTISRKTGLDIHPDAMRAIKSNLKSINGKFRRDAGIMAAFMEILASPKNPTRVLRLMNESGFLGKLIPDFGAITAMMQFDMYHSYTVDEHTITAIGVLNDIETGALKEIAPKASAVIGDIHHREELYAALLLHDIAKGRDGDHSVLGEKTARRLGPQLGFDAASTDIVAWLVRNHLLMSVTAFRYDLNDPQTIMDFALKVESPERLNLLLVLTVADIRAVGPDVWNGWKAELMRVLYARAMAVLRGENIDDEARLLASHAMTALDAALRKSGWRDGEIKSHIAMFHDSYWTGFDTTSHIRHAEICRDYLAGKDKGAARIILEPGANDATELIIIAGDHKGLFARIAGGVASTGARIIDARITTRRDGIVLDVFRIQGAGRKAITEKKDLQRLEARLEAALGGSLDIIKATDERHRATPQRIRALAAPARVMVSNSASRSHTVLEINGKDAPGLLYRITGKLAELGLQIRMASVSTYGDRVVDVFYVQNARGRKITGPKTLQRIEAGLQQVLRDSDPANEIAA